MFVIVNTLTMNTWYVNEEETTALRRQRVLDTSVSQQYRLYVWAYTSVLIPQYCSIDTQYRSINVRLYRSINTSVLQYYYVCIAIPNASVVALNWTKVVIQLYRELTNCDTDVS